MCKDLPRTTGDGYCGSCVAGPEGIRLEGGFLLPGKDLAGLLSGCREAVGCARR